MAKTVAVKIAIKNWISGSVLFQSERDNIKEALRDAVLQDADLRGADLQDAVLQDADLRGAVLRGAVLRDADLQGADLRGAVLRDADLQGADLRGAVLQDADLRGAVLRDADLRGAVLRGADLRGADLRGADLRGAVLQDADLRGIPMANLPQSYIDNCSKDILYVLNYLKDEVPFLKEKLLSGGVDGSQYTGDCACLVGTLAKAEGKDESDSTVRKFCQAIPFYTMSVSNPGEEWFLNIRKGDTPKDNEFSRHALTLCNMVLGLEHNDGLDVDETVKS